MDPLLCFPADLPAEVTLALQGAGLGHHGVDRPDDLAPPGPDGRVVGYAGALVVAGEDMTAAVAFCRHLRLREVPMSPLLLAIGADQVGELLLRDDLYDDFCVLPARPDELVARVQHLFWRAGQSLRPDIIEYGPLMLNLETYQAAVVGPDPRPHLHGVRAPALPGRPPRQGLHPRDVAQPRLGLRVLRRCAHSRRPHSASARRSSARSTRT